jgi:hypothetical protein
MLTDETPLASAHDGPSLLDADAIESPSSFALALKELATSTALFELWLLLRQKLWKKQRMLKEVIWLQRLQLRLLSKTSIIDIKVGGWSLGPAGTFLLTEVLGTKRNLKVLEFGLGESTKLIGTYGDVKEHLVLEHNIDWVNQWKNTRENTPNDSPEIIVTPMLSDSRGSKYDLQHLEIGDDFNFYLIDGPFGAKRNSRNNIVDIIKGWDEHKDFIIFIDDIHRIGELQTFIKVKRKLKEKGISFRSKKFFDRKAIGVICSEGNWAITSF